MAHNKHGIGGTPDPDFAPDERFHMVYDEKKGVYRKVLKPDYQERINSAKRPPTTSSIH